MKPSFMYSDYDLYDRYSNFLSMSSANIVIEYESSRRTGMAQTVRVHTVLNTGSWVYNNNLSRI